MKFVARHRILYCHSPTLGHRSGGLPVFNCGHFGNIRCEIPNFWLWHAIVTRCSCSTNSRHLSVPFCPMGPGSFVTSYEVSQRVYHHGEYGVQFVDIRMDDEHVFFWKAWCGTWWLWRLCGDAMACHGRISPRGLHMKLPKPPRSVQTLGFQPRFSSFLWDLGIQELRAWQTRKVSLDGKLCVWLFKCLGIQVSSDTPRHTRPNVFRGWFGMGPRCGKGEESQLCEVRDLHVPWWHGGVNHDRHGLVHIWYWGGEKAVQASDVTQQWIELYSKRGM